MQELSIDHKNFAALSNEILQSGNAFNFKAQGNSMRPFILSGDVLTVKPVSIKSLRIGDVLFCYTAENQIVVHRLVGRQKLRGRERLIIKGDNVHGSVEEVSLEQVLGRVSILRRGDRILNQRNIYFRGLVFLWIKTFPLSSFLYYLPGRIMRKCHSIFKRS